MFGLSSLNKTYGIFLPLGYVFLRFILFMHMCACLSICVPCICRCPRRPEEGVGPQEAGLIGTCEQSDVVAVNPTWELGSLVCARTHWGTFTAPPSSYWEEAKAVTMSLLRINEWEDARHLDEHTYCSFHTNCGPGCRLCLLCFFPTCLFLGWVWKFSAFCSSM